ncbi:MAG TPA: glycosyltransferase family 1 protein [Blastocatellia bacterium]|nr:glycosyltransferase family 1 protein [Blastocatellia bacterium]
MRILVDATAAISGGRLYLEKLLPQLAELHSNHEFLVFHTGDLNSLAERIADEQFRFVRVTIPFLRDGQWAGASVLRLLWRKFVLPTHLRRLQPDLLFSNSGAVPRSKPAKTKTVIALHNCMPLNAELIAEERSTVRRWRLKLLRRQMRKALGACDGSLAFSEDTRRQIAENFGALPHTPSVVHHAIDWGERERQAAVDVNGLQRLGVAQPYFLYVSQFHRYKNVLRLVEAFARLAQHQQLKLVLVGGAADSAYWTEIENTIDRLNLRGRVVHVPACPREQLIALYRGALAFVQPSLAVTCSFPLLEALALGVPAAVARQSALPEMAGDAAVYFNPYRVDEIVDVMDRLVCDEQLRGELRGNAILQAARFSWQKTARQTMRVFERTINFPGL